MNIEILYNAMSHIEKKEMLSLLLENNRLKPKHYTDVETFVNKNKMSTRLKNILMDNMHSLGSIESIGENDLKKYRGVGKSVINEFIKLRGY